MEYVLRLPFTVPSVLVHILVERAQHATCLVSLPYSPRTLKRVAHDERPTAWRRVLIRNCYSQGSIVFTSDHFHIIGDRIRARLEVKTAARCSHQHPFLRVRFASLDPSTSWIGTIVRRVGVCTRLTSRVASSSLM